MTFQMNYDVIRETQRHHEGIWECRVSHQITGLTWITSRINVNSEHHVFVRLHFIPNGNLMRRREIENINSLLLSISLLMERHRLLRVFSFCYFFYFHSTVQGAPTMYTYLTEDDAPKILFGGWSPILISAFLIMLVIFEMIAILYMVYWFRKYVEKNFFNYLYTRLTLQSFRRPTDFFISNEIRTTLFTNFISFQNQE